MRAVIALGKVFKKINFSPSPALLKEVAAAHPGAIERLLFLLKNQVGLHVWWLRDSNRCFYISAND